MRDAHHGGNSTTTTRKSPESRMHLKVPVRFGGGPMEKDRTKRATPRPRPTQ